MLPGLNVDYETKIDFLSLNIVFNHFSPCMCSLNTFALSRTFYLGRSFSLTLVTTGIFFELSRVYRYYSVGSISLTSLNCLESIDIRMD